jgi:glycosyltransferase involved in cell wall biosynthesis
MATVLHLTASDMSLELLLGPQLEAFGEAGYDVVTASAPGPYATQLEQRGIRHVPLSHVTRSLTPVSDARAVIELYQVIRSLRPDIIHTHNPKPGVYGRVVGRLARVPVVVNTVHGLYATPGDRRLRRLAVYALERIAAAFSHAELVQNPEDLDVLRGLRIPAERLHLLGNGIDLRRFDPGAHSRESRTALRSELGIAPDDVVIGAVGRLVREKGYPELFAACTEVRRTLPGARLVVAGPLEPGKDDALGQAELDAARDAGVLFLGLRHDVERLYSIMDIFVLASHREGYPRAAMEASAMGCPVVATDIRGCRQVVDDGRTGILVPVRNTVGMAAAITELASDPERRRAMGAAARAKAIKDFDDTRVIQRTLDVYERLLSQRSGVAA